VTFYKKEPGNETASNSSISSETAVVNSTGFCLNTHEGQSMATSALYDLTDPARPKFCEYISGTPSSNHDHFKGIAPSTCPALSDIVDGFDQATCQKDFCHDGVEGYNKFVNTMVAAIERNGWAMGLVLLLSLLVQVVQLHVLHNLHKTHVHSHEVQAKNKDIKKPIDLPAVQQPYVTVEVTPQQEGLQSSGSGPQSPYVVSSSS